MIWKDQRLNYKYFRYSFRQVEEGFMKILLDNFKQMDDKGEYAKEGRTFNYTETPQQPVQAPCTVFLWRELPVAGFYL